LFCHRQLEYDVGIEPAPLPQPGSAGMERRQLLKLIAIAMGAPACADDASNDSVDASPADAAGMDGTVGDSSTPADTSGEDVQTDTAAEPDTLPRYEWQGEPIHEDVFSHGVASGDPLPDAVILWTRVQPSDDAALPEVWWEISVDEAFERRAATGTVDADPERGYCVKIDAAGLAPDTRYFYRFFCGGRQSIVGRTRTAAQSGTAPVRLAFCSCSNYTGGYFHNYRHIAAREDLNAVLHLGDYIYEYASPGDAVRPVLPDREIVTLDDYRERYATYRTDPDLQAAHAAHPFIAVWDDHETTNNAWRDGAGNHDASEGDYAARKLAAWQAWSEWLPVRDQEPGRIWRQLRFGDLIDLLMLDTRVWGRDAQVEQGGVLDDPDRQILGADQEAWLLDALSRSTTTWRILGQQVPISPLNHSAFKWLDDKWGDYPAARERIFDHIEENEINNMLVFTGDVHTAWGVEVARDPYDSAIYDTTTSRGALAVELVCPGISSGAGPGLEIASIIGDGVVESEPHVRFCNAGQQGYVYVEISELEMVAEWHFAVDVNSTDPTVVLGGLARTLAGTNRLVREV
jgi:alkaline phosphatase D